MFRAGGRSAAMLSVTLALAAPAFAQDNARAFYRGKQLQFATMGTPGGG